MAFARVMLFVFAPVYCSGDYKLCLSFLKPCDRCGLTIKRFCLAVDNFAVALYQYLRGVAECAILARS